MSKKAATSYSKQSMVARINVVNRTVVPLLLSKGFERSPFHLPKLESYDNLGGFCFMFYRLLPNSILEQVGIYIPKSDNQVKLKINVFELYPHLNNLHDLTDYNGLKYLTAPNCFTQLELGIDEYDGIKRALIILMKKNPRLGNFKSNEKLEHRINQLNIEMENLINSIDTKFELWHKCFKPNLVDWDGNAR